MRQIRIAAMALGLALALVACGATVQDPEPSASAPPGHGVLMREQARERYPATLESASPS